MITVDQLSFTYPKAPQQTLRGLSFEIDQGEVLGFLGPSGAGKSTTQKILIGLLRGWQGQVTTLGRPLTAWGADYYERIGVSFEVPNHFLKLTARENLAYFASLHRRKTRPIDELLQMVDLQDDGDLFVAEYSKGMKNRLNVARALLHDPDVLFLDEPTAGLDPVNARRIKDLLAELKAQGRTIFLCTHDMTVADEVSDRVAFIVGGEISLIDSPRHLKIAHGQRTVRVEYGGDGARESREFPLEGLADNEAFRQLLRRPDVQTVHSQETTLERIFIQVTGRELV